MILEYRLDYRSSSLVYEKIFLKALKKFSLNGKVIKDSFLLKLYVQADDDSELKDFATYFSKILPHSIFLYNTEANIVDKMPDDSFLIQNDNKLSLPFCLECLKSITDVNHKDYYNIFKECDVCGYGLAGEERSYKNEFEKVAQDIKNGDIVEINTFYGNYFVGTPSKVCNDISFDIVAYDLATIQKYTNVKESEILALGAFEKPLIKLKKKIQFTLDFESVEADIMRFKLSDDFVLYLLMQELHKVGIDIIFITKDRLKSSNKLLLVDLKKELEPIEVVASKNKVAIVLGEKGLPSFSLDPSTVDPLSGSFFSVIKEHKLNDANIAGVCLSKKDKNAILVYGKKYGVVEYLSLNFKFSSMNDIFNQISSTDETGIKIVKNYKNKFPEHFERLSKIVFDDKDFNIFKLWGVVAIVLNFTQSDDPVEAAKVLEENALSFLGDKGPRIDYKLLNKESNAYLDPLMTIRTAMSFHLAGIDRLMLSYGVLESFVEFLANELDELKNSMDITATTITGSLLENRTIFFKINNDISINHKIYFNNQLPVDGKNMFYGGVDLN